MQLHADEFTIDDALVRGLLRRHHPAGAEEPLTRLDGTGTVHVLYRLGDRRLVRLPRLPAYADAPRREAACLSVIGPHVPLTVPRVTAVVGPTDAFPASWSVVEWIEGEPAGPATIDDVDAAAATLGRVVRALRAIRPDGSPPGGTYRAEPLVAVDADVRGWVQRLPADIDRAAVIAVWDACVAVGPRSGRAMWLHGDLRGDNLIARDGSLVGVIDWEGATVGDPSVDLLAAWWLFDAEARAVFRQVTAASPDDWERGRGWALQMAVAAIPYYRDTNPGFVAQARLALTRILEDR